MLTQKLWQAKHLTTDKSPPRQQSDKYIHVTRPLVTWQEDPQAWKAYDDAKTARMQTVMNELIAAARFAHELEKTAAGRAKVVGPLSMFIVANRTDFQDVLMKAFPSGKLSLHQLFVNITGNRFEAPARPPGIKLASNKSTRLHEPIGRPPAREFYRFVPRELRASVKLAWADEIIDMEEVFISSYPDELEVTMDLVRIRVFNTLWELCRIGRCLLCTHELPAHAVVAMRNHANQQLVAMGKDGDVKVILPATAL